jgi:NAD(P)-dependent dehydrogenase (short-subunit alcohol dehydrogenase family)
VKKQVEKLVVISGGAGGIGKSSALKAAELDYYPILLDRDEAAGRKASAELEAAGFESEFHCVELTSEQQVDDAFAEILARHQRVDALVNLAGGTFHKSAFKIWRSTSGKRSWTPTSSRCFSAVERSSES